MAETTFYIAAAVAVLLIGAGIFYATWQLAVTIKHLRQTLLPQVELTLTEVQRNLNRFDDLTKDVDVTVEEANQLVHSANKTVEAVGEGIQTFNKRVAVPLLITTASALEGLKAGLSTLRSRRKKPAPVIMVAETPALEPPGIEAANI